MTRILPAFVLALSFTACTPMDHTNPYDPSASTTAPNRVAFSISNQVAAIAPNSVTLTWARNTEADFACYLILRSTVDPGAPSEITLEQQTELGKTNHRAVGLLDTSNQVAAVFPKVASGLRVVGFIPEANTTTFVDTNVVKRTEYQYRILSVMRNLKTFSVSTNVRLETPSDDFMNAFYPVYSPFMVDINRTLIDVDYDEVNQYLYVCGTANGLLKTHGFTSKGEPEYFIAKAPLLAAQIDLEVSANLVFLSGNPVNPRTPTRFRGFAVTNGTLFVGAIRSSNGVYESGGLYVITNASTQTGWLTNTNIDNNVMVYQTVLNGVVSNDIRFGDWGSLFAWNGGNLYYFSDALSGLEEISLSSPGQGAERSTPTKPQIVNGIAFDDNGKVYASSLYDNTLRKYDFATGELLWTRGGAGSAPGQFQEVGDVAYFKEGTRERIYITDPVNNRVTVFDEEGNLLSWTDTVKVFGRLGYQPRGLKVVGNEMLMTVELGIMRFSL